MLRFLGITFGLLTQAIFLETLPSIYRFLRNDYAFATPGSLWIDAGLALQFVLPHSILLYPKTRAWITRRLQSEFYGSVFCLATCRRSVDPVFAPKPSRCLGMARKLTAGDPDLDFSPLGAHCSTACVLTGSRIPDRADSLVALAPPAGGAATRSNSIRSSVSLLEASGLFQFSGAGLANARGDCRPRSTHYCLERIHLHGAAPSRIRGWPS